MNDQPQFICSKTTTVGQMLSRVIPQITKQTYTTIGDFFHLRGLTVEMFPLAFELADGSAYIVTYEPYHFPGENFLEVNATKVDKPLQSIFPSK